MVYDHSMWLGCMADKREEIANAVSPIGTAFATIKPVMLQVLANGLVQGFSIALLAWAFVLVYAPTRVFHLALAGIYALSPYIAALLGGEGLPEMVAFAGAVSAGVMVGLACEVLNHGRLDRRGASSMAQLVSSLALYTLFTTLTAIVWGRAPQRLPLPLDPTFSVGPVTLAGPQSVTLIVSALVLLLLGSWLKLSTLGIHLRAMADNPVELSLRGVNTQRLRLLSFAFSGAVAAVAALLAAVDVGFDPYVGMPALLVAVVAVIAGGRQWLVGTLCAALTIGIARSMTVWLLSARWQDTTTFVLLAFVLFLRPSSLLRRTDRVDVA